MRDYWFFLVFNTSIYFEYLKYQFITDSDSIMSIPSQLIYLCSDISSDWNSAILLSELPSMILLLYKYVFKKGDIFQ